MLQFFKKHWFGLIIGTLAFLYFGGMTLIFFSPREDALGRGFIPCTKKMSFELYTCQNNKSLCLIKAVAKNNYCDFKVIFSGLKAYFNGKQNTPWENYLFEAVQATPEIPEDEELKAYFEEHQKIFQEMEELNKNRIILEQNLEKTDDTKLPK